MHLVYGLADHVILRNALLTSPNAATGASTDLKSRVETPRRVTTADVSRKASFASSMASNSFACEIVSDLTQGNIKIKMTNPTQVSFNLWVDIAP
jgi:hypothetical protein